MLSRVCGVESNDKVEEISVNKDNESHTIFPVVLFNASLDPHKSRPHGRSQVNDELKDEGGQDGQPHLDNSSGIKEMQESEQSLQSPREGDQVDILKSKGTVGKEQPDKDGSGGLEVRQESTQLDSPYKVGEELSKSQRTQLWKKEKKREKRKREQEEDQESGDASNRFDKQEDTNIEWDSADGVDKRRKKKKK